VSFPGDIEGERHGLQIATGAALEFAGLCENFDAAGPALIRTPAIEEAAIASLEARAQRAMDDLIAGRPLEPTLDLALFIASRGNMRLAGAVYLAYWDRVDAMHKRMLAERNKLYTEYKATLGADRKKDMARDFAAAVAATLSELTAEYARAGRQLGDESCSVIAKLVKGRLAWGKSDSTYWRYVRSLLRSATAIESADGERSVTSSSSEKPAEVGAAELQSMLASAIADAEVR
jgi:hypothetical protein